MIYVVDYGAGNILSVIRALKYLKKDYCIISEYSNINHDSLLIIPGVGNFSSASERIRKGGFDKIKDLPPKERPFVIGICLGMQMLFSTGLEGGESPGLDLLKGSVEKINVNKPKQIYLQRTIVGWEEFLLTSIGKEKFNFLEKVDKSSFYHVHSYMCMPSNKKDIIATYPEEKKFIPTIVGSLEKKVIGFQFHPEKSGKSGLFLIELVINVISNINSKIG
ncbi:imidazole glycerol phosphate synthase subunit HisH [bacterium]|nr:imidazole glycerol phosphate synthase subunit HisH [bacterium]|tara:strand:- start:3885 stop:4547 length:663 start_codon:yes stop_codon:yes gene_type:complete